MDFTKLTDRELDAEVAKRMGCKPVWFRPDPNDEYGWWQCLCDDHPHGLDSYYHPIHEYSTTWEGAGQVLEWSIANLDDVALRGLHVVGWTFMLTKGDAQERLAGPRAICEAFCMAVPEPK